MYILFVFDCCCTYMVDIDNYICEVYFLISLLNGTLDEGSSNNCLLRNNCLKK